MLFSPATLSIYLQGFRWATNGGICTAVAAIGATDVSNDSLHLQQPFRQQPEQLASIPVATRANIAAAHWLRVGTRVEHIMLAK